MRSIRKSFFSPHRPIDKSIDTYVFLCELSSHWALIFCSAQIWANLTPGADKNKYADLLTGKVYCVLMLVKRSTLQRLRDRSRFFVNSAVRRSYMIRYMNNLYQRSNRRAFWRARCLICIRFWSWRNLQQMNTAQKAMTRTLWKPLIKICSVWYVICPLKSQFKRDVATEFLKIALRNTSEGTSFW